LERLSRRAGLDRRSRAPTVVHDGEIVLPADLRDRPAAGFVVVLLGSTKQRRRNVHHASLDERALGFSEDFALERDSDARFSTGVRDLTPDRVVRRVVRFEVAVIRVVDDLLAARSSAAASSTSRE
jgi:hypothetical protein